MARIPRSVLVAADWTLDVLPLEWTERMPGRRASLRWTKEGITTELRRAITD
jgi:hypothetical protein